MEFGFENNADQLWEMDLKRVCDQLLDKVRNKQSEMERQQESIMSQTQALEESKRNLILKERTFEDNYNRKRKELDEREAEIIEREQQVKEAHDKQMEVITGSGLVVMRLALLHIPLCVPI